MVKIGKNWCDDFSFTYSCVAVSATSVLSCAALCASEVNSLQCGFPLRCISFSFSGSIHSSTTCPSEVKRFHRC